MVSKLIAFVMVTLAAAVVGMANEEPPSCAPGINMYCIDTSVNFMVSKCCKTLSDEYACFCKYMDMKNTNTSLTFATALTCQLSSGKLALCSSPTGAAGSSKNAMIGIMSGLAAFVCSYLFTIV